MTTIELLTKLYDDILKKRKVKLSSSEFSKLILKSLSAYSSDYKSQCSKGDNSVWKSDTTKNTQESSSLSNDSAGDSQYDHSQLRRNSNVTLTKENFKLEHDEKDYNPARRREILLMLTCIKMVVENELEKEDEVREEYPVLNVMRNEDILEILLDLIRSEDKFVSFAALNAMVSILRCTKLKDIQDALLRDVVERILDSTQIPHQARYLDLLKHLMANRCGLNTNRWCYEIIKSCEIFTPGFARYILSDIEASIERPHNYLHLLQKTIKYLNKLESNVRTDEIQATIPQIEQLLPFSVHCIQNVNRLYSRLLLRKVLDVFHELLKYSDLTKVKIIHCLYRQTADRLLSVISPAVLQSMPFERNWVGFGGSRPKGCEFDNQNGDSPLLRKLILLLLKSCAVSVKSNSESGVAMVQDCIEALDIVVRNSFPSAPGNLEWLPLVFSDQDDDWIESLLCLLDMYLHSKRLSDQTLTVQTIPHRLFLQFLDSNWHDHMVLVDLLTSPETCFLVYFLRYLKCVVVEWTQFVDECHRLFKHEHMKESDGDSDLDSGQSFDFANSIEKVDPTKHSPGSNGHSLRDSDEYYGTAESSNDMIVETYLEENNRDSEVPKSSKDTMTYAEWPKGNAPVGSCNRSRDTIAQKTHFQATSFSELFSCKSSDITELSKDKTITETLSKEPNIICETESFARTHSAGSLEDLSKKWDKAVGPCKAKKVKLGSRRNESVEDIRASLDSKSDTSGALGSAITSTSACYSNQSNDLSSFAALGTNIHGLASLTGYGSGSESNEDCQEAKEVSVNKSQPQMNVSRYTFHSGKKDTKTSRNGSSVVHSQDSICETQDNNIFINNPSQEYDNQPKLSGLRSKVKLKPPPGGSTVSCDLQCVELVMSVLIRVRLRIDRLSEQDIFPYNPSPLLSLIEQCEALYEDMDIKL